MDSVLGNGGGPTKPFHPIHDRDEEEHDEMADMTLGQVSAMLAPSTSSARGDTWFEAMADAWGDALNNQAAELVARSDQVASGFDTPAEITALTAESLRMSFISNSSHTSLTSVGSALETLARKQ